MADEGLIAFGSVARAACAAVACLAAFASSGCGPGSPGAKTTAGGDVSTGPARPYPEAAGDWAAYRSARFRMTIPLPNARAWKIDDRSRAELVGTDASTQSTLTVLEENEPNLVNRQLCEERAKALGLVPVAPFQPIEDATIVGPAGYDTRVVVAIERGGGKLVGHVFAFGGRVRKCLVFHLSTTVPSEDDEKTLSQRLALARLRTLGGIRVAAIGTVPRGRNPP